MTLQASDERPHALADRDKVVQVLTNLLSNAPKFTSPGGQVWIRTLPQGGLALIEVQDTGTGIPPG